MKPLSLPTELILSPSLRSLGSLILEGMPQPGTTIQHNGHTYTVLERRHRYHFKANRYHLHKIVLYVQVFEPAAEKTLVDHRWVVGDVTCRYNARSELIRCAINPVGPCSDCPAYTPLDPRKPNSVSAGNSDLTPFS